MDPPGLARGPHRMLRGPIHDPPRHQGNIAPKRDILHSSTGTRPWQGSKPVVFPPHTAGFRPRADIAGSQGRIKSQIKIIAHRARNLRLAITFVSASLLLAAVLVISLFLVALLELDLVALIITLFVLCMAALCIGLVIFIQDVNHSMAALKIELEED